MESAPTGIYGAVRRGSLAVRWLAALVVAALVGAPSAVGAISPRALGAGSPRAMGAGSPRALGAASSRAMGAGSPSAAGTGPPIPIPDGPGAPYTYTGAPATPQPIRGTGAIPQNPYMAANGLSEIHDDEWQSDVFHWGGPLGRSPQTFSNYLATSPTPAAGRDCGSITFDRQGRVIAICIGVAGPVLYMFDPNTLATLATYQLPPRTAEDLKLNPGLKIFQDFSAGGYFYLNQYDQVVTGTTTGHIYVIGETAGEPGFQLLRDYPLGLRTDEEITSQLPDSHGLLWFTARLDGVVGTLNFRTGKVHIIRLGSGADGEITKSLAADSHGGVYIPTNQKLYRFVAGPGGVPRISWQVTYPNDGVAKPGQLDAGTGTTPVLDGPYVAINDNENPMDVVIYRTAVHPSRRLHVRGGWRRVRVRGGWRRVHVRGGWRRVALPRQVCRVPVFPRGQSAGENAMIAAGRSFIIENNYGYQNPTSVEGGMVSAPGFARVDVNPGGRGCRLVWVNDRVSAPSVVSKLSLANGLIYTYTTTDSVTDPWYWTALDFRTGRVVYSTLAGTGVGYNNNYAGIALGPNGTEYLGVLGGIVALRDGP